MNAPDSYLVGGGCENSAVRKLRADVVDVVALVEQGPVNPSFGGLAYQRRQNLVSHGADHDGDHGRGLGALDRRSDLLDLAVAGVHRRLDDDFVAVSPGL